MIFGTVFTGHVKTQEKQYVETKMFCFVIPLYVMTTMLVTETEARSRRGLEIKSIPVSIIAAILRSIVSVAWFFSIAAYLGNYDTMKWLLIPLIISTALLVYAWFYFGKTTNYERFVRGQFAKEFGLYFMPGWLKPHQLVTKFEKLKKIYISKYGTSDWKEKIRNIHYYNEEFSLPFCLTALENTIAYNPETEKMLKEISKQ